jgi:hypothetical protein
MHPTQYAVPQIFFTTMKRLISLTVFVAILSSAFAQEGLQGTWFATSQLGIQQTKFGEHKHSNFTILPIVGNFVKPTVAVGVAAGYINVKAEADGSTIANSGLLVVEPLVRKYWNVAGNMYFFGQLALPVINGKEKESDLKVSQYGVAASGGLDMILGKHFSVEFSYNLINASLTTLEPKSGDKTTVTDLSLAHVANVESAYNSALAGSNPTLTTPLAFGFKFLF